MTSQPKTPSSPTTSAFFAQAALSFGISLVAISVGIAVLPVDPWVRAFLAIGALYTITSAFTLAKVIRDRQEDSAVASRIDRARVEKLLAEHDPFRPDMV
ncbi:YiaA/YiaB family inner membrane protein [Actinokineospora sp. NBRC 105648]|uniref:YiaA/YiaB family inner membrane protein n=1 Tax=Actinokineospora sp. NBRC 105648 TaxID=3032206 RepID=UPI00255684D4|nr:YiaA/YiaB family inner membrane protein [Actinokineospora sp. NBRC 105648]